MSSYLAIVLAHVQGCVHNNNTIGQYCLRVLSSGYALGVDNYKFLVKLSGASNLPVHGSAVRKKTSSTKLHRQCLISVVW